MRKCINKNRATFSSNSGQAPGQAIVEYILMIVVALFLVGLIASSFRKTIAVIWGYYFTQISAACPGCPPNPSYRFR